MSKFKFKCAKCGKTKEVKTEVEAGERVYCSQACARAAFTKKKAKESREIKMDKIAGVQTKRGRTEGIQIVDMEVPRKKYKPKEILLALRSMSEKLDKKYPTETQWRKEKGIPSADYIIKVFGSWKKAIAKVETLPPKIVYKLSRIRLY